MAHRPRARRRPRRGRPRQPRRGLSRRLARCVRSTWPRSACSSARCTSTSASTTATRTRSSAMHTAARFASWISAWTPPGESQPPRSPSGSLTSRPAARPTGSRLRRCSDADVRHRPKPSCAAATSTRTEVPLSTLKTPRLRRVATHAARTRAMRASSRRSWQLCAARMGRTSSMLRKPPTPTTCSFLGPRLVAQLARLQLLLLLGLVQLRPGTQRRCSWRRPRQPGP
mmetsp:Transcript_12878/g.41104  ORF Transcript_12878/g.41104 Transcript_12878/m.41104 type:complete len:228 (-) Transcript_12878:1413-2096(-)